MAVSSSSLRGYLKRYITDFRAFSAQAEGFCLRNYQWEAAQAILNAIQRMQSDALVVMFPRQSGKNTLQAQLEAYLLWRYQWKAVEMVKVSPTWKPQSINAMQRLESVLQANRLTRRHWRKESGYIYRCGKARLVFFSGSLHTNIVGATASLLLQLDEAQDILPEKYDKDIAPMAAASNAPVVFWGTAWTAETLLGRELRAAQRLEQRDGRKRAFVLDATRVAQEVPAYGHFVEQQVQRLGRQHPLVRTQYFSEEISTEGRLFSAARLALMQGNHSVQYQPQANECYALLMDVGGEEHNGLSAETTATTPLLTQASGQRDSSALTVVQLVFSLSADQVDKRIVYQVVQRYEWTGLAHTVLYGQVKALMEHWQARYLVIDASGLGMGLASFLQQAFVGRVIPFVFTAQSKSRLGWDFIALIESGRYKEYTVSGVDADDQSVRLQVRFYEQLKHIEHQVKAERGNLLQWGVPPNARDPLSGGFLHDDLVISAALCACLDELNWGEGYSVVIHPRDPLQEGMEY